ncbi:hypothetical protein FACS1894132_07670 [Clostridia bacterium]|nr:hypothetical protein FACS1894132_07670 [Clostridia bacterium]
MDFGLSKKQLLLISEKLKSENVKKAVIFGSRAKGNYRLNSDIDIAVFGVSNLGKLISELDELPLPYKFDVVSYENIYHGPLREHIDRVGVIIYEPS